MPSDRCHVPSEPQELGENCSMSSFFGKLVRQRLTSVRDPPPSHLGQSRHHQGRNSDKWERIVSGTFYEHRPSVCENQ